ncbi:MAG: T9SS type A sorting domain-containing protein [bacterium]
MKIFLITLTLVATIQGMVLSQTRSQPGDGRDFIIGGFLNVPHENLDSTYIKNNGASVLVSSYYDNDVTLSYFDKTTGSEVIQKSYHLPAHNGLRIPLDLPHLSIPTKGDSAEFATYHLTGKKTMSVIFYSNGPNSGGSYLAIQTPEWGKRYVAASYPDYSDLHDTNRGFFLVVAQSDSTVVMINPSVNTAGGHQANVPYIVKLSRGQSYLVKSAGYVSTSDISGSIIQAIKSVAVISGHEHSENNGRKVSMQQLLPENFLDTTGYVAIPFSDSASANCRVYATSNLSVRNFGTCTDSNRYLTPTNAEVENLECPVAFEAQSGSRFGALIYDQTMGSMMNLIPRRLWRNSYIWQVPFDSSSVLQNDYITVIADRADFDSNKVFASVNGGTLLAIQNVISLEKIFSDIPHHPTLKAARYKLGGGSYYATAIHPLMVYSYGTHAVSIDSAMSYYSYSSPAGFAIAPIQTKIGVGVDTLPTGWRVCAHDSTFGLEGYGIKGVVLMDDQGDCYGKCPVFRNCHLDGDTSYTNEIVYSPPDTDVCFNVSVLNVNDSAYAPLYIYDSMGNATMIELHYYPPTNGVATQTTRLTFTLSPNPVRLNSLMLTFEPTAERKRILIFDLLGKQVFSASIPGELFSFRLSTDQLSTGTYYLRLESGHLRSTQKFEIVH